MQKFIERATIQPIADIRLLKPVYYSFLARKIRLPSDMDKGLGWLD